MARGCGSDLVLLVLVLGAGDGLYLAADHAADHVPGACNTLPRYSLTDH